MKPDLRLVVDNDASAPAAMPAAEAATFAFSIGPAGLLASINGKIVNPCLAAIVLSQCINAHLIAQRRILGVDALPVLTAEELARPDTPFSGSRS